MSALWGLLRKEVYHILRDRRTLAVLILLPVVEVILFGYAIRTDVYEVRLAVVDPTPDYVTLAIRHRFDDTGLFQTVAVLPNPQGLESMFQEGRADAAVVFENDFAGHLARGLPARVLVVADATEPNTGSTVQAYATNVVQGYAQEVPLPNGGMLGSGTVSPLADSGASRPTISIVPDVHVRFNPTAQSSNLFVPGLMALVLTLIAALMTALSLTREKEMGTMEALLVSPLRPWQIIVGKVAPYLAIGFLSVMLVIAEAKVVFQVPLVGSIPLLLAEGLLYILVSLSVGILVSARTSSQRVAMMGALIGTMLPTQLLSGFVFPIESMPRVLQWVANIVPAKWFLIIARGIMLKGIGLGYLWSETLVLAGMAFLLLVMSVRSFHARLE